MKCILCNFIVEEMQSYDWLVPNIGLRRIGFSICKKCGLVQQSPSLNEKELRLYYRDLAIYTNPGREGKPDPRNIAMVDEQIKFITRGIGYLPKKVFQVGSSDGYTLNTFREKGSNDVFGIEPTQNSCLFAKQRYNVLCENKAIEDFKFTSPYDLILLTHVLEHLENPIDALYKCRKAHEDLPVGYIYIEVPLLDKTKTLCPGLFTLEHRFYFSRAKITELIENAGYEPISIVEHYEAEIYPVIGILASTKSLTYTKQDPENEYVQTKSLLAGYFKNEKEYWGNKYTQIYDKLKSADKIYIWGAGAHTSLLFSNTSILNDFKIDGILDSAKSKWGLSYGQWKCMQPKKSIFSDNCAILISSYNSEDEIFNTIKKTMIGSVTPIKFHSC